MLMKSFARVVCSVLLKLTLYSAAIIASLVSMFASSEAIKSTLADSKVYDNIISTVAEAAKKDQGSEDSTEIPEDKRRGVEVLEQSATQAFTPDVIKNAVEQGLDGIYNWLNGKTPVPDFQIDLTQAKANFIASAGQAVESHVAGLPVCTREQLATIDPETDPLSLTCRPANLSAAVARDKAVAELANNDKFFPNPVLTSDNLSKNEDGKTVFEQAEGVPRAYRTAKALPWVFLGLGVLLGIGVYFLSETRRKGLKSLGISLLGTGAFLFVTTWLFGFLFDRAARPGGPLTKAGDNDFQEPILAVLRALNNSFNRTLLVYCIVYVVVGTGVLIGLHFTRSKEPVAELAAKEENKQEPTKTEPEKEKKTV
jgi:hypothetical protein